MARIPAKDHGFPDEKLMRHTPYARHRGVTRTAVEKAFKSGRIDVWLDSKNRVAFYQPEADKQWEKNTQSEYTRTPTRGQKQKGITTTDEAMNLAGDYSTSLANGGRKRGPKPKDEEKEKLANAYGKVRTSREMLKVRIDKTKLLEMEGKLVDRAAMIKKLVEISGGFRDAMLAACTRLAPTVVGTVEDLKAREDEGEKVNVVHEVEQLLLLEVRSLLTDMSDKRFENL